MKKIVAMLLALCMMVTAFAGCGTSSSTTEGSSAAKQESAQTAAASGNAEENAAPAETTDFTDRRKYGPSCPPPVRKVWS